MGITMPVFFTQNQRKLFSPLSQPKCQPKNFEVSLALPDIDHSNSGTATKATPTPNVTHVFHFAGLMTNKDPVTTNSTARLCR